MSSVDDDVEEENEEDILLTPRQLKVAQELEWQDAARQWRKQGITDDKTYINFKDTQAAYGHVLDTGDRARETLELIATSSGKNEDWVENVKHNAVHRHTLREVMKRHAEHPMSERMVKKGVLTAAAKRGLKSSNSINSLLNSLSDNVSLTKRVENLETVVALLVQQSGEHGLRLDVLESDDTLTDKERAHLLHKQGYSLKEIGDEIGKSRQTVSKWLKDNQSV
jgi:hypothetical protein